MSEDGEVVKVVVRRGGFFRTASFVTAVSLTTALIAFHQGSEVTASCGTVSTPLNARLIQGAETAGGVVHALANDEVTDEAVTEHTIGLWATIQTTWHSFGASGRGAKRPADAQRVMDAATSAQAAALSSAGCGTTRCQGLGGIPAKAEFTAGQLAIARTFAEVARRRGLPDRAVVLALAGAFQESGVRNLSYGDSSSVGVLQLIDSNGTRAQRMDPAYSVGWFYDGLVRVPGWESRPLTQVVQAVQRSAFPDRYAQWEDDAQALFAAAGRSASASPQPDPAQDCSGAFDATVVTWNSGAWNSTSRVLAGFRALANDAQVIAGQELPSEARRAAVARAMPAGWRMYPSAGGTRKATAVPILVDTNRLEVIAQGRVKVITRHVRVEHGSDGNTTGPKFVTWVTVRDGQGRRFSVVNTHLVVSASAAKPRRLAQWRKQVAGTLAVAGRLSADPVVITCDCNAQSNPFGGQGFDSSSKALGQTLLTHTNRTLDYVATAGAEPAGQALAGPWGSDHKALLVTFKGEPVEAPGTPEGFDMPGNRTVDQAVAYMTGMAKDQTGIPVGRCLHYVAAAYGHETTAQAYGRYWARDVFATMPDRYKHPGAGDIPPRGALVFWDTGGPGHIALSLGGGKIASTDYPRAGVIGIAPISEIDKWGKRLGWTAPYFADRTRGE